MKSPSYLIWFRRLLVLGAVIAGVTASAAGASVGRPPDVQDTASAITGAFVGSPPDIRDTAATLNVAVPDVLERFATAHPYGLGLSSATQSAVVGRPPDIRDTAASVSANVPDVVERFASAHPYGLGLSSSSTPVSRPPDVTDAALAAQTGSLSQSSGFHWGDWAIGIGTGMGLILLLAAGLMMGRQVRQPVQTA
jgi:hypothetical protein